MRDKISVVLPTYNGSKSIRKSIESVISQTYDNWELIIVNDCSTDNTSEIIKEYADKDPRISVITNETNKKLPASLNIGFEKAIGEYLTWTSDDNMYHKDAFEVLLCAISSSPDIDMVYSDFRLVNLDGEFLNLFLEGEPEELKYKNTIGASFLYKRSLAESIGQYDTGLFLAEDYEYWIRAYLNGKILHIKDILYDYGWHDKSLTATKADGAKEATFKAKQKHFDALLKSCHTQDEKNRFFTQMLDCLIKKDEIRKYRKEYYAMDRQFAAYDTKKRIKAFPHNAYMGLKKAVKKIVRPEK